MPVMLYVMLAGLGRVVGSMQLVTMSTVSVMGGLLMSTGFVMLGCLMVMSSSRLMMLSGFSMVLCVGVFTCCHMSLLVCGFVKGTRTTWEDK